MTQEKEALKLALEALEREARGYAVHDALQIPRSMRNAIVAIKEVLAQPEQIPPSAYSNTHQPEPPPECPMDSYGDGNVYRGQRSKDSVVKTITLAQQEPVMHTLNCVCGAVWDIKTDGSEEMVHTPLYTTPPQRKPLSDYVNSAGINANDSPHIVLEKLERAIEAEVKGLNNA